MKKIIIALLALAMFLPLSACSGEEDKTVITVDDIKDIIESVKKDYAASDEMKLSDGTVVSAEIKNPGITIDDVKNGTATAKQKNDYIKYLYNIRILAVDRLSGAFGSENHIVADKEKNIGFIFLDPKADGFENAAKALSAMGRHFDEDSSVFSDVVSNCIYLESSRVIYFDKDTDDATLLCPTTEENDLLLEIMK